MGRIFLSAASVGIIGGADGPTAIFVTGDPGALWVAAGVGGLVILAAALIINRRRKSRKERKTP